MVLRSKNLVFSDRFWGRRNYLRVLLFIAVASLLTAASGCSSSSQPAAPPPITVSIAPTSATVQVGLTRQFTSTVQNTSNTSVTWQVNGVTGGDSTHGTISTIGLYTAPGTVPSPSTVTVTAVSQASSSVSTSATVTVAPAPITISVAPSSATLQVGLTQQFTSTVQNTNNTAVTWQVNGVAGGNATVGTISTTGLYTAPGSVPTPNTVTVTAISQASSSVSASATVTVAPAPIIISVAPMKVTVQVGLTQQFTSTVQNTNNTAVTWQVNGVTGGNGTVGTISTTGLYSAPGSVPSPNTVTVTAVSQANSSVSASATITVAPLPDFTLSAAPGSFSVNPGGAATYTVSVGPLNGFTGSVSLSASGLPSGATASFSPASVSGSGSSTLTVTTTTGTAIGSSTLTITGITEVAGSVVHTATVTLTVTALSASLPNPISIQFVGNGTAMASSEVAGEVALTNWNPEQGASGSTPMSLMDSTGSATTATVSWQADDTYMESIPDQSGNYRMMLGYLDNANQDTTTVTVSGLSSSSSGYTVYVYANGDTSGSVTGIYQISGTGITTTSTSLTYTSDFNGTFTQANNSVGNYLVFTIPNVSSFTLSAIPSTASSGYLRAPVNGIQIVPVGLAVSNPSFTMSASPSTQTVSGGGSTTYTVNVGAVNGFTGSVGLSASGLPSGATASFSPASVSGAGPSTLTVTTTTGTAIGSSTLTLTGTSGSLVTTSPVTLVVTGSGTTVSVSISPIVVALTTTQSAQFTATVQNASNTAVTWSVDGIVGGNSTVGTISASGLYTPPATAGQYNVTATSVSDSSQSAKALVVVTDLAGTFTRLNNNSRTGQNLQEYALTPTTVNQTQFGKLFSCPVDGYVYASPLYVANLAISGQGTHNVVFVATERDDVYAFDADNPSCSQIWYTSFINPSAGITTVPQSSVSSTDIVPEIGVTGTPVIDPSSGTLYVVAKTEENGTYVQRLHALDITTGAEKFGGPVVIQASVAGSGDGSSTVSFNPLWENQRAALLLANGVVYIAWGSHGDLGPYHGWLLGYNASTLQQVAVWNSTPNGSGGGIWQGGDGPSADSSGNIYAIPENGTFDANTGGADYGGSFVKLSTQGGGLTLVDYFTPYNQAYLNSNNWAPGTSAPVLVPVQTGTTYPNIVLGVGKDGTAWLVNQNNMGGYNSSSNSQIIQTILISQNVGLHVVNAVGPAFWQNNIPFLAPDSVFQDYLLSNDLLSTTPISQASTVVGFPGGTPVISANGSTDGIVWVLDNSAFSSSGPAVMHAYDAANAATEYWNSSQAANARDQAGPAVKFTVPTVANGKVYVGGQYQLTIYGLLN